MAAAVRSSDQFLCSICLEVFTEPVSTPCEHNFCKTCITQAWAGRERCFCPMCKEVFNIKPELRTNTFIKEMVSQFKLEVESMSAQVSKPVSVLCDVCSDPKLKAVKSCPVCLASYCDTHLQPHLTMSGLKRHQLMEPVDNLEDRLCLKHDKPLELFCRTDNHCVCMICPYSEHQYHKIVPLKEEVHLRRSSLQETQAQTQRLVEQRQLKILEIGRSLELSQKVVDRERAMGLQVFTALMQSVQERQEKFIDELQEKHRQTQKQAQDLITELEQEICELEKRSSEVQQLSHSEDHLHFIQSSTLLRTAVTLKNWSTISFEPQTCEGSAARALAELDKSLTEFKKLSARLELHRVQQFAVNITLDPDTANPKLALSKDLKQVHHTGVTKAFPENPKRFQVFWCVLGKQSFSSGRFYFEVQVKGKTAWWIGVVKDSVERKKKVTLSPLNGVWVMGLSKGDQYMALTDPPVLLSPQCPPQKMGVFVDYDEGLVSFYDVNTADLIYSFTDCCFKGKIFPILDPDLNDKVTNSSPLILTEH